FVFFCSSRRRHTRFSRDWSSDVCSSDLDSLRKAAKAVLEWGMAAAGWAWGSAWNLIAPVVPTPHSLEVVRENMPILAYRIAYLEVRCDYQSHPKSTYRLTSWIYREHVLKPVEDA